MMHPWLKPRQYVATLRDVDPKALCNLGIRGVLIDLDNTLVSWRGSEIEPDMETWVKKALAEGLKLCIVSNTWRKNRIHAIAERLGVPYILRAGKPRRGSLRRGMEALATTPSQTAVIGDQIFTDVVGGNRIGAYTILCVPMPGREFFGTQFVRQFERFLMRKLADRGHLVLPGSPPAEPAAVERAIQQAEEAEAEAAPETGAPDSSAEGAAAPASRRKRTVATPSSATSSSAAPSTAKGSGTAAAGTTPPRKTASRK